MKQKMTKTTKSKYDFRFNGIEVSPRVEVSTKLRLTQFLALAPPSSTAVGVVEKDDRFFMAAIEVTSPYRTFFEKAGGTTPDSAIKRALDKMEEQLYRWRYGGGQNGNLSDSSYRYNQPLTQG